MAQRLCDPTNHELAFWQNERRHAFRPYSAGGLLPVVTPATRRRRRCVPLDLIPADFVSSVDAREREWGGGASRRGARATAGARRGV